MPQYCGITTQASSVPWSLVYSADTRPNARLIAAGRGCSLLIHEATLPDSRSDKAKEVRHCTVGEALQVAGDMEAERVVLTHFSQSMREVRLKEYSMYLEVNEHAFLNHERCRR